jgi:hypothetical protein
MYSVELGQRANQLMLLPEVGLHSDVHHHVCTYYIYLLPASRGCLTD